MVKNFHLSLFFWCYNLRNQFKNLLYLLQKAVNQKMMVYSNWSQPLLNEFGMYSICTRKM